MIKPFVRRLAALARPLALFAVSAAQAHKGTIRFVVPYPAGGAADQTGSSQDFGRSSEQERARWNPLVRQLGIKAG